ncbi:hypothetical protein GCM10022252_75560 [Streptosporangium oxazolinicum]|uniref:Uncharacterized protein n=1 Tax=Streptosporangium oxazolinicum TaxID=909287 RepID=A0ABP8BKP8_9ACTN
MRRTATALLAVLLTTGCAAEATGSGNAPTTQPSAASAPAIAATLPWGSTAGVKGANGSLLMATPTGVFYWRGTGDVRPHTKWFLAVAIRVASTTAPDHVPSLGDGGGFSWKGDGQTVNRIQGNTSAVPWSGNVPTVTDTDIQPENSVVYVETFDVPAAGGVLVYTDTAGQQAQWDLPPRTLGKGLRDVIAYTRR